MLSEIVSGAEKEGAPNDRLLAVLRVGYIARYAPSLAPCYKHIIQRHSANLTIQIVIGFVRRLYASFSSRARIWPMICIAFSELSWPLMANSPASLNFSMIAPD